MRERCTNAAFVTAELDLARGQATRLTAGRLRPGATHQDFGIMTYDPATRRIEARLDGPDGPITMGVTIEGEPWHLYDFDLASLTITAQYRPRPRSDFSFGLPLIWPEGEPAGMFRYLGRAELRFVREESHQGRRALRFEAGGAAFAGRGGPIWFDAREGHLLGAAFGVPNHPGYTDFALRLTGVRDDGAQAWRALLTEHFEGCPSAGGEAVAEGTAAG
jgi:hypothetical protein